MNESVLPFIFLWFSWNIFLFGRVMPIPSSTCFFSWKAALQTQSHRPALFNALHNWCSLLLLLLILLVFWWCFCLLCFCSGCCCMHMRKDMANLQYVMCLILVPSRAVQGCWSGISDHSQTDTVALPHPLSLSLSLRYSSHVIRLHFIKQQWKFILEKWVLVRVVFSVMQHVIYNQDWMSRNAS